MRLELREREGKGNKGRGRVKASRVHSGVGTR